MLLLLLFGTVDDFPPVMALLLLSSSLVVVEVEKDEASLDVDNADKRLENATTEIGNTNRNKSIIVFMVKKEKQGIKKTAPHCCRTVVNF